jgi:O-antigen chain-terminating methyltransferase
MSDRDPIDELQEKLNELTALRLKEEEEYGKLLTTLDQSGPFQLPAEFSEQLNQIKDALNRSWDISREAFHAIHSEDRVFWKEVAGANARYISPVVREQKEFNSQVVHILNEFIAATSQALSSIRNFHNTLILYFQKIIPVVDTKNREVIGIEDKNVALNLNKFQNEISRFGKEIFDLHARTQEAARQHTDALFKLLDQRMESQEVDGIERDKTIRSLETSVRSLQHVAAAWSSAREAGKASTGTEESRYIFFEERFRGSREWLKDKFREYVPYFQTSLKAAVVDLGCGRGEFLELLKEAKIPAKGVDSNQMMVQKCRELGLDVSQGDLLKFLQAQPESSLGGIFSSQVIEHLPPEILLRMLETAFSRLKQDAPILLETVNIASVFALSQVFSRDLTHSTPIHPETLEFMVNACGFRKTKIIYTSPVPAVQRLKLFPEPQNEAQEIFNHNMQKLNQLLYAPQEFAVYAIK